MAHHGKAEIEVVVEIIQRAEMRKQVASEFYGRAAKLTLDGWTWQDALIHVGKDFGLFSNDDTKQ